MRGDRDTLLLLAEKRRARTGPDGRPRFNLSWEDAATSAATAMRLAQASVSCADGAAAEVAPA